MKVKVIGAGLAGCEAAWQLANLGIEVDLYEMRPHNTSPAHKTDKFAELVCSNSLRSNTLNNAVGILKEEMRKFDSLIIEAAYQCEVPAGSALAVDRDEFSDYITNKIKNHPLINVILEEVDKIDVDEYTIIATGPLTSEKMSESIKQLTSSDYFYFYDAAAPIIELDSINFDKAFFKDRWDDENEGTYINCPMSKVEFENWYEELINAKTTELKSFEENIFFEGCMPFEEVAKRGKQTLLFGALKPVGLRHNGESFYSVVQLRQDNSAKTLYNLVGFQTHLTWPEQKRIIQMIPGLENANIVRYGVMHRNTYINSPKLLNANYQVKKYPKVYFAGQITGVEGYVESCASGLVAALAMARQVLGKDELFLPQETVMGCMSAYVSNEYIGNFQPMNANFGLLPELTVEHKKRERKELYAKRALQAISEYYDQYHR